MKARLISDLCLSFPLHPVYLTVFRCLLLSHLHICCACSLSPNFIQTKPLTHTGIISSFGTNPLIQVQSHRCRPILTIHLCVTASVFRNAGKPPATVFLENLRGICCCLFLFFFVLYFTQPGIFLFCSPFEFCRKITANIYIGQREVKLQVFGGRDLTHYI